MNLVEISKANNQVYASDEAGNERCSFEYYMQMYVTICEVRVNNIGNKCGNKCRF